MSLMGTDTLSPRTLRRFSREFRSDAVALVLDGARPVAALTSASRVNYVSSKQREAKLPVVVSQLAERLLVACRAVSVVAMIWVQEALNALYKGVGRDDNRI